MFKRIITTALLLLLPLVAGAEVIPLEGGPFAPGAPRRTGSGGLVDSRVNQLLVSDQYFQSDSWSHNAFASYNTNMPDPFGGFEATQFNYTGTETFFQMYQNIAVPDSPAYDTVTLSVYYKWVAGTPQFELRIYDASLVPTVTSARTNFSDLGVATFIDAANPDIEYSGPDANGWYRTTLTISGVQGHAATRYAFSPFATSRPAGQQMLVAGSQIQFSNEATTYIRTPSPAMPTLLANYVDESENMNTSSWSGTGSNIEDIPYYGMERGNLASRFVFDTGDGNYSFWQNVDTYSSMVNVSFMTKHIAGAPAPAFVLYDNDEAEIVGGVAIDYETDGTYSYTSYGGDDPVITEMDGGYIRTSVTMVYQKDNDTNLEIYPFSVGGLGDEVVISGIQITDGDTVAQYSQNPELDYWLPIAAHKWADAYEFDIYPERYWEIGQYEMFQYQAYPVFTPSSKFDDDLLRAVNPDIEIGYYVNLPNSFAVTGGTSAIGSYLRYLYDAAYPTYTALDTEGEFWYPWNAQYALNATVDGFAETIGDAIISMLGEHSEVDPPYHLMWDYFSAVLVSYSSLPEWINANPLDLDQDGVAHTSDSDERAAMHAGWYELLDYLNARLPVGVSTVANGNFFQTSADLRARLDGLYVEGSGSYWKTCGSVTELPAMIDPDCPTNINALLDDFDVGYPVILESQPGGAESATNEQASVLNLSLAMLLWEENRPFYGVVQGTDCDGAEVQTSHCLPEWGTLQYWGQFGEPLASYYEIGTNTYQRDFQNGYVVFQVYSTGTGAYPFRWFMYRNDGSLFYSYTTGTGDSAAPVYSYGDVGINATGATVQLLYAASYSEPSAFEVQWRKNAGAWSGTINLPGYFSTTGARILDTGEAPVEEDTYEIQVRATDPSSNVSGWTIVELVMVPDITPPVLSGGSVDYTVEKVQTNLTITTTLTADEPCIVQYYWRHNDKPAVPIPWTVSYATDLDTTFQTDLDVNPGDGVTVTAIAENEAGLQCTSYIVGYIFFETDTVPPDLLSGSISLRESGGLTLIDWTATASEECTYELNWSQAKGTLVTAKAATKILPLDIVLSGTIDTGILWQHEDLYTVNIRLTDSVGNTGGWELVGTAAVDDPPVSAPTISGVSGSFTSSWVIDGSNFGDGPQSGLQEINIGNDPIFEDCSILVEQTVTAWATDQVTATANSGSFGPGTYFLFVTNDNGDTSVGWSVSIAGAGDPDILSVAGSSATTWTITGNNFTDDAGEDTPLVWENFEEGALGATIESEGVWTQRCTGDCFEPIFSTEHARSVNGPQVMKFWNLGNQDYVVQGELLGVGTTDKFFFSTWVWIDYLTLGMPHQYKMFRVLTNDGTADTFNSALCPSGTRLNGPYFVYEIWQEGGSGSYADWREDDFTCGGQGTSLRIDAGLLGNPAGGRWHLFQVQMDMGTRSGTAGNPNSNDAIWTLYENGAEATRYPTTYFSVMDSSDVGSFLKQVLIGHTITNTSGIDQYDMVTTSFWDDVYFTNTWRRVELGNNSVYEACTVREIQPLVSWSAGSPGTIVVTANQGSFDTGTAYLFVVNADGDVSPGYLVNID